MSENSFKLRHDIECATNEIKFEIPNLITKIEYNKLLNSSINPLNLKDEQLEDYLKETKSFLSHLKSYCKAL